MCVLVGNTVKTETGDYPCKTREEAEALFMTLREREASAARNREAPPQRNPVPQKAEVE